MTTTWEQCKKMFGHDKEEKEQEWKRRVEDSDDQEDAGGDETVGDNQEKKWILWIPHRILDLSASKMLSKFICFIYFLFLASHFHSNIRFFFKLFLLVS